MDDMAAGLRGSLALTEEEQREVIAALRRGHEPNDIPDDVVFKASNQVMDWKLSATLLALLTTGDLNLRWNGSELEMFTNPHGDLGQELRNLEASSE